MAEFLNDLQAWHRNYKEKFQKALFWINIAMFVFRFPRWLASLTPVQVNNPLAHEMTTGPEIIEAVISTPSTPEHPSSGKVDVLIAGAGTGGT